MIVISYIFFFSFSSKKTAYSPAGELLPSRAVALRRAFSHEKLGYFKIQTHFGQVVQGSSPEKVDFSRYKYLNRGF